MEPPVTYSQSHPNRPMPQRPPSDHQYDSYFGFMSSPSLSPASSKSPTSPSTASSSSDSTSSASSSRSQLNLNGIPELSDEELAQLSVRQLNMKLQLQGQDRKIVTELKQKRRTLKNRGYALNCRVRRVQNQMQLEADIAMLRGQVHHLTETLRQMQARLQYYEPTGTPPPIPTASSQTSTYYNFSQGFTTQ